MVFKKKPDRGTTIILEHLKQTMENKKPLSKIGKRAM